MSVKFTTDGYIEPMKPRMSGLAIGAGITLAAIPAGWFVSWCLGAPLFFIGLSWMANERGQRRYRVTRTKLLIEDEPMIRGFVIGPIRNRVPWEDVVEVQREGAGIKLTTKSGDAMLLGEGGTDQELAKFLNRIELARED